MRKLIVLIFVLLSMTNLFCISNFAGIFSLINPSAKDVAFGLDSGTADIYNMNPLSVWSNPAKLGYQKGLSFGYSHVPWLDDIFSDIFIRSSYLSFGWNGIGVLIPTPSANNRWGTVISYGEQEQTDDEGNVISIFESYEACTKFAIGINSLEFISNLTDIDLIDILAYYGDISLGFNYDIIYSKLTSDGQGNTEYDYGKPGKSHSIGYGLIGRLSPLNNYNASNRFFRFDVTAGLYFLNPERSKISYFDESQMDPLPYGTRSAFSGKFSANLNLIPNFDNDNIRNFINNILTVYYSQDNAQYGDKGELNPSTWGKGLEITFFDFFSVRKGEYIDKRGRVTGDTDGLGFNINFKDIIQFQYNIVNFPGGELQKEQDMTDFLFRIDLLKSYDLIKKYL